MIIGSHFGLPHGEYDFFGCRSRFMCQYDSYISKYSGPFNKKIRILKMLGVFFLVFLAIPTRTYQIEQKLFEQDNQVGFFNTYSAIYINIRGQISNLRAKNIRERFIIRFHMQKIIR